VTLLVRHGPWQIAVGDDDGAAGYVVDDWLEWSDLDPGSSPESRTDTVRAIAEVRRGAGGVIPRALIGGEMRHTGRGARQVRVGQSSKMTLGAARTCASLFRGMLVPGLPPEFAQAALDGVVRVPAQWDSGDLIVVDRAAYDEVDSSPVAFEFAGGLLVLALLARLAGSGLDLSGVGLPVL
jgi:hypothetical protein